MDEAETYLDTIIPEIAEKRAALILPDLSTIETEEDYETYRN
jgi:hypothetical protein